MPGNRPWNLRPLEFVLPFMVRLSGLLVGCLLFVACSSNSAQPVEPPTTAGSTATSTVVPVDCPVLADRCRFAIEVEAWARGGQVPASAKIAPELAERARAVWAVTGALPRVTTIGCPQVTSGADCAADFAVVLTSLPPGLEERDGRGVVVMFFAGAGPQPWLLRATSEPPTGRRIVVSGGDRCFIHPGLSPAGGCVEYRFIPFGTGVPEPSPPPPSPPPALRMVPGATTKVMTLGDPYHIEPGQLWYFTYLCDACGPGPIPNLYRAYRDAAGAVVVDDLRPRTAALGTIVDFTANWQQGLAWVAVCDGACGPVEGGGSIAGAKVTIYRSTDGAITWTRYGILPDQTNIIGVWGGELIAARFAGAEAAPPFKYFNVGSGQPLNLPQRVTAAVYPVLLKNGTLLWRTADGTYHDGAGTALFGPLFAERIPPSIVVADVQYQHTYLAWGEHTGHGPDGIRPGFEYVARIDRDGQMREIFALPSETMWIMGEFRREGDAPKRLYGRFRFDPGSTSFGAVLDLRDASVHRLTELEAFRPEGTFVHVRDLIEAPSADDGPAKSLLRVRGAGAGDCLNLRSEPSKLAAVSACYADGVLLADLSLQLTVDGITWRRVSGANGQSGWVSGEFLGR